MNQKKQEAAVSVVQSIISANLGIVFGVLLLVLVLIILCLLAAGRVPLGYMFRNIIVRWRTSILTIIAFTLVVGILMIMLGFVMGMYKLTESGGNPHNVIILSEQATDEAFSNLPQEGTANIERHPAVKLDTDGMPLISRELYLVANCIRIIDGKERRRLLQVRGIENPDKAAKVHDLELQPGGQWFSLAGVREAKKSADGSAGLPLVEVVLGEGIAGILGGDLGTGPLKAGDVFPLGDRDAIVTAIMKSAGTTYNSEIWGLKRQLGEQFRKETTTSIVVRTKSKKDAKAYAKHITDFKETSLNAMVEREYYQGLSATNLVFLTAIIFVALFMALGGTFGVMNTMFAAVSQRRKDIGVLRIIGYSKMEVLAAFLLESVLLAFIGGLCGLAVGLMVNGWKANSTVGSGGGGGKLVVLELLIDWKVLLAGLFFSLFMGLIGGLFPAINAMRLRPLESMR